MKSINWIVLFVFIFGLTAGFIYIKKNYDIDVTNGYFNKYINIKTPNNSDSSNVLGASTDDKENLYLDENATVTENNKVWNVNIADNIFTTQNEDEFYKYFPKVFAGQKILNLYPDKNYYVYPILQNILYKSDNPEVSDIKFDKGYFAHYINFQDNSTDETPMTIKIYKLPENTEMNVLKKSLDYMFDYKDDFYERIFVNSNNILIWGAYVPWDEAQKFPMDYKSKISNFILYIPERNMIIELGISYKENPEKIYQYLTEYIRHLENPSDEKSVENINILKSLGEFSSYPIYKDNFISRLSP